MKSLIHFLNAPMNDSCDLRESLRTMFLIGLFVALFLGFFKPFGLASAGEDAWPHALVFGLITFIAGMLTEFIEIKILRLRKDLPGWTFWKWLVSALGLMLVITVGNWLYANYLSGWDAIEPGEFLHVLINTLAIGIFPITFFGAWNLQRARRHYSGIASGMQAPYRHEADKHHIRLPSKAGEDLELIIDDILCVEASQNYLTVHMFRQGLVQREMIRNTLKEIRTLLDPFPGIMQCHRSFLVNLDHVADVSGNSQGLILSLPENETLKVPVSRPYIPAIRHRLQRRP